MYIVDYNNKIINFPVFERVCCMESFSTINTNYHTITWGVLPFGSNIISNLIFKEEAYLWEKLFFKHSLDFLRPINYFNNVTNKRNTNDLALVKESKETSHPIIKNISDILRYETNYLDFLHIFHAMAKADDIYYEMFQKSFFYEIFFYLLKKETLVFMPITLAICKRFTGFYLNENNINDILDYYCTKYAYMIIPRRYGKTRMVEDVFVSLLLSVKSKKNMKLGYYSHTKDLSQSVKNAITSKCKIWATNLLQSRYNIFTPTDCVVIKTLNDQNTTVFSNSDDDFNCLAKFKSARNDNALRGDDLNILVVDESLSLKECRYATILAHCQKEDNKFFGLTSPVNHKMEQMYDVSTHLRYRKDINFYHISYFCNNVEHLKYAVKQPACPRLIFYKPNHININHTNKFLTNLLARSSTSYDDEQGIVSMASALNKIGVTKMCPFSEQFMNYMQHNVNIIKDATCVENVFLYLDPNYHDSVTSGIGLVASGLTKENVPCVLYLDHKFIEPDELGRVNEIMIKMLIHCIHHMASAVSDKRSRNGEHKIVNREFFVVVENNSEKDACVIIYNKLKSYFIRSEIKVRLYYAASFNSITKEMHKRAGYTLLNKFTIFTQTIQFINEKLLWFSNLLHSYHLNKQTKNEIEYLRNNMLDFKFFPQDKKYSGKSGHSTDDLVVALVLSIYFARTYTSAIENSNWFLLGPWERIKN